MRHARQQFGDAGEDLAASFLHAKGYRIHDRNVRTVCGELDLVCTHGREVIIVEVKTRSSRRYGAPEESVTRVKREHLIRAAHAYLARTPEFRARPWRIDVVAITSGDGAPEIVHIERAVGEGGGLGIDRAH